MSLSGGHDDIPFHRAQATAGFQCKAQRWQVGGAETATASHWPTEIHHLEDGKNA